MAMKNGRETQMDLTILVTGGCGFIGSNFIHYMLETHPHVRIVNLDKLTYAGNPANLSHVERRYPERYRFRQGDIADRALVSDLFREASFDVVVNFAAESHVDRSIEDSGVFIQTNVMGTQTLLESFRRFGGRRFLQISTDEVYGSLGPEGRFKETSPIHPRSPYAASKAAADLLVTAYVHTYGTPAIITRCSNNYGPFQFPEKMIPLMITNALEQKPLPVYGDGMNVRDWIYVTDHCRALDLLLREGKTGEVYNIGGDSELTNIQLVHMLLEELARQTGEDASRLKSLIRFVEDRPGHDRRYAIDFSKLSHELGWSPQHTFLEGMKKTVRWYIEHRSWWEKIKSGEYQRYYRVMYGNRAVLSYGPPEDPGIR